MIDTTLERLARHDPTLSPHTKKLKRGPAQRHFVTNDDVWQVRVNREYRVYYVPGNGSVSVLGFMKKGQRGIYRWEW